jgi:ABC-type dipeptide/oligopeptide/nickel transport system permease subunit
MSAVEAEPLPSEDSDLFASVRVRGYWATAGRRLLRQPATLIALVVLVAILLGGAFAHRLAPGGWNNLYLDAASQNQGPTLHPWHRLLGTDHLGRSVLDRTIWGLHFSEISAVYGALIATGIGILVGAFAGMFGGWFDNVLMRIADFATTFPVIVTIIVAFSYFSPITVTKATLVFAFYLWAFVARIVRARVKSIVSEEFVEAARALGASDLRILARHVMPNAAGVMIVALTAMVGQIVLIEATAEFFGFGVASLIRPTLGNLIAESTSSGIGAYSNLGLGWWNWVGPAALLVLVLVCVNLVGDGLANALEPRSR